ncbi:MAG TPA: glycosyl hydrolase family 18 protein [Anaerolineales bacterium]|nr:glycosyl hydrolase family 18 protein [Anaerolineales bacterium]
MLRLFLSLNLFAVLLTACSPSATPISSTSLPPSTEPTVILSPTPPARPFIILAYATDGIFADIIPYDKLTHINYSFLTPKADGTFNPIINGWKLKQIVRDAHAHDVKVSISVGGWGWDAQFEELAAAPATRTTFVRNLKAFVDEYGLDGVDMDWEYPDQGQSSQNFFALIEELRLAMPDKLLTAAVVSYGDDNGLGIPSESFELFDFVNIMTYDGPDHGTMEQFERGLSYWSGRGLPKEKIVMGVPFYGDPNLPYFKIVQADPSAAQTDTFDQYGTTFHYNGIPTLRTKTRIAMEKAGGIMFWALDHDAQGDLSLVSAIHETAYPNP